jgi:hypothetical protein
MANHCYCNAFWGQSCPSSWEPLSWVQCEIAKSLYNNATYQVDLNQEVLELIPIKEDVPANHIPRFCPKLDQLNPPILKQHGELHGKFCMFVENLLSACIHWKALIRQMIVSSIEVGYILLGYPGPIKDPILPPVMAWDNMEDRAGSGPSAPCFRGSHQHHHAHHLLRRLRGRTLGDNPK